MTPVFGSDVNSGVPGPRGVRTQHHGTTLFSCGLHLKETISQRYCDPVRHTVQDRKMSVGQEARGAPTVRNLPKVWEDSKRTFGGFEGCERWRGSTPPIGCARARESLGNGPPERQPEGSRGSISDCRLSIFDWRLGRGSPLWLAVQHREVDVGHLGPPARQPVGSSGSISDCRLSIFDWRLGRGSPLWLAVQHREVDIGHGPRGAPLQSQRHPDPDRRSGDGSAVLHQILRVRETTLGMTERFGSGPPNQNCQLRIANCQFGRTGPPCQAETVAGRGVDSTMGLHPPSRGSSGIARGGPPRLAVQRGEVDIGRERCDPPLDVGRTFSSTTGISPPKQSSRHPERSEGSASVIQILRPCETGLRMTNSLGCGPPWLAVQHREVDVGRTFSSTTGNGPPKQSRRHPERSPELVEGRSEGSATVNQILRVWETTLRMTEGFPVGRDAVSTTRHREVDVGRGRCGLNRPVGRTFSSTTGMWPTARQPVGCTPPRRYERARESIARLVVITSNLPKVHVNAKATLGRCNTGRCKTTRSCASDAEHEFSRTRSPGRYPMLSFRDPRGPQLLLMQPSLLRRREVGKKSKESVFMIDSVRYGPRLQSWELTRRGEPRSGSPPG